MFSRMGGGSYHATFGPATGREWNKCRHLAYIPFLLEYRRTDPDAGAKSRLRVRDGLD